MGAVNSLRGNLVTSWHLVQGNRNTPSGLMQQRPEISTGLIDHLHLKNDLTFLTILHCSEVIM